MNTYNIIETKSANFAQHSNEKVQMIILTVEAKNRREALKKAREIHDFGFGWHFDMRTLTAENRRRGRGRAWARRYISVKEAK